MKTRFSSNAIAALVVFAATVGANAATVPVNTGGSVLRNVVVVTGANVSRATNFVTNIVATNLGLVAYSSNDRTNANPNTFVTNLITVTNVGNIPMTFIAKIRNIGSNGVAGGQSGSWASGFGSAQAATVTTPSVAKGGVTIITLRVTVPAGVANGFERGYVLSVSNNYSGTAIQSNYLGDDALRYGGSLKRYGASLGAAWVTNAENSTMTNGAAGIITAGGSKSNQLYSIRVRAAAVAVTKRVETNTLGGNLSRPIPGATITWKIIASNYGGAAASSLVLYDRIATNLLRTNAASLRTNNALGGGAVAVKFASAGVGAVTAAAGDDQGAMGSAGANYPAGVIVEFTPRSAANHANLNRNTGGTLPPVSTFSGWYKTTIR